MVRELLVQVLAGTGYYEDTGSETVTLYYIGSNGDIDTSLGDSGKVNSFEHLTHGIWSVELNSGDLAAGRTDFYQIQYDGNTVLSGYENFHFPTVALTPSDISNLTALIAAASTPDILDLAFNVIDNEMGVSVAITAGWNLSAGDTYKVSYEIGEGEADPDSIDDQSRFVLTRQNPVTIPIALNKDGCKIICAISKVNGIGNESVRSDSTEPQVIAREFTIESLAEEIAANHSDILAGKVAEKDDFASAVSGKM
jgi:hypothetical protein